MNHFFNLQSFKWWPTRELSQGKTHQSGGKENAENNQEEERRKERKLNNNDANPIANDWGPRDSRPFRQAFSSETKNERLHISRHKMYNTNIDGRTKQFAITPTHARTITHSCETHSPQWQKKLKKKKQNFPTFNPLYRL